MKPTGAKVSGPVAWLVVRREIESLESNDEAVPGTVSESPGRNANERIGGLVIVDRRPSPQHLGEGRIGCRKLTDAAGYSGGVIATARWQGHAKQLEKPSSPAEKDGGTGYSV
jgi:hypothetical protein